MAGEKGFCLWFTGLSGSGKTTITNILVKELRRRGSKLEVLDGDIVRQRTGTPTSAGSRSSPRSCRATRCR
jgi:adenylylsulfate kinase-like enzyme